MSPTATLENKTNTPDQDQSSSKQTPPTDKQASFLFDEGGETESKTMSQTESPQTNHSNSQQLRSEACFQLKSSSVPLTSLELLHFEAAQFQRELESKTRQAPGFFENLPVVIGLERFDPLGSFDLDQLIGICRQFSIRPIAIRGGNETHQHAAQQAHLAILRAHQQNKEGSKESRSEAEDTAQQNITAQEQTPSEKAEPEIRVVERVVEKHIETKQRQISKIVHHPVRSGQQIYAADGDLIVLASVSAGAEILADGNIHVYGALRGRALAGVQGDSSARIFCHSLEAELVSIAGQYKISEDIDKDCLKKPAQIFTEEDKLTISELEL